MKEKNYKKKIILYSSFLILGLLIFILQLFIFEAPDGVVGFLLCLGSIYLMMGGFIKLCKLSKKFRSTVLEVVDLLF